MIFINFILRLLDSYFNATYLTTCKFSKYIIIILGYDT